VQVVRLWHTTGTNIESALTRMLKGRMMRGGKAGPDESSYVLTVAGDRRLDLVIEHRGNRVRVAGAGTAVDACVRLIHALDNSPDAAGIRTEAVPLKNTGSGHMHRAVEAIQTGAGAEAARPATGKRDSAVSMQKPPDDGSTPPAAGPEGQMPAEKPAEATKPGDGAEPDVEKAGLVGPVQVELLEGLDVLIVRGHRRDVEQVMAVIQQIERLAQVTEPAIEVYSLRHVDCEALAVLVDDLYGQIFEPRLGTLSVTALVKPNALLLIGQRGNVDKAIDLVKKLDRPVAPETQFRVFRLRHASAETLQLQVQEFYTARNALGVRATVTADFRSNSVIVMARPRDMIEVAALIEKLDTSTSESVNEIRVFKLENSLADDLAPILQDAIIGDGTTQRRTTGAQATPQLPGQAGAQTRRSQAAENKATMLSFLMVDARAQRRLKSGILTDVRITADSRANALVVSAPAESMPLLEALVRQLDQLPSAEAQIKVFTIINGDATSMVTMLETLFAQQAGTGRGAATDQLPVQVAKGEGESSLVPLRFAVDVRTNSIIASGTTANLAVVEAILLRLDESDVRNRKSLVYRLRNAPATDVANAINEFLRSERQVQQISPGLVSAFEQIEREVIVVPEVVSNSLIISATPRFYDEIIKLIEDIDKRPPMVMIQVLIAEVTLNDTDEFGVELGLQDSILFNRSILSDIVTTTTSVVDPNGTQTQTQNIVAANITPGFNFNGQPLGNSGSTSAQATGKTVATQAGTSFGVGRTNSQLGFGGLVLSASSESVNILIRALKETRRLDVLSRPQVMTLDNQPAFIQVGQEVPTIRGTTVNQTGQVNNIDYANVGLILGVTPRISPDGLVVMEIDAVKSAVGPEAEGIPVSISATGQVIRSPRIDTTRAQTTVSSLDGQTIVLGGLITKSKSTLHRRVPFLSSIPIVGNLFRYDNVTSARTELLIIMTPHIVQNEQQADKVKQAEAARMSWCLADVIKLHGDAGLRGRCDQWNDSETEVVYPDLQPSRETIPAPAGTPADQPETIPAPNGSPFAPEGAVPIVPGANGSPEQSGIVPGEPPPATSFLPAKERPPFRPLERLRQQFSKKPANQQAGFRQVQETRLTAGSRPVEDSQPILDPREMQDLRQARGPQRGQDFQPAQDSRPIYDSRPVQDFRPIDGRFTRESVPDDEQASPPLRPADRPGAQSRPVDPAEANPLRTLPPE
jgi:general secretion pathway protein D